jgi:hypothetical protein
MAEWTLFLGASVPHPHGRAVTLTPQIITRTVRQVFALLRAARCLLRLLHLVKLRPPLVRYFSLHSVHKSLATR